MIETLSPRVLAIPDHILELIPPRPPGYPRGRESFPNRTGFTLDPLAVAEAAADHTLALLLHPQRANRLVEQQARNRRLPGLDGLLQQLQDDLWARPAQGNKLEDELRRVVQKRHLEHLLHLSQSPDASGQAQALAQLSLQMLHEDMMAAQGTNKKLDAYAAHLLWCQNRLAAFWREPETVTPLPAIPLPDGAPIGAACGGE